MPYRDPNILVFLVLLALLISARKCISGKSRLAANTVLGRCHGPFAPARAFKIKRCVMPTLRKTSVPRTVRRNGGATVAAEAFIRWNNCDDSPVSSASSNKGWFWTDKKGVAVPISLDCETCYGIKLLRVQGALGESEGLELIAQVTELLEGIGDSLIIDLSEVPSINSAGIGSIVRIQAQANTQEQTVIFAGPKPIVRGVFSATRLDKFLRIYSSREEAIQAVRQ